MGFFELLSANLPNFLAGLGMTVVITLISLILASIVGVLTCYCNLSRFRILRIIGTCYVDIIRGTPLLVQAFFIYFGIPQGLGIRLSSDMAGIITMTLNAGAYLSEIFRSGIQAIDKGQMEAARSLGLPARNAMVKIIVPQAFRIIIPSLVNQFIITLKDTSIMSAIGMRELTQVGKLIIAVNFESFKIWAIVALLYLIPITILSKLSKRLERNLSYGSKGKRKKSA